MPQLTRYLYFLDECFHSLMFAVIRSKKNPFDEVAFWAGEIYYSGFHLRLWQHIWQIYYDFYAIKYPKYERKINKLSKETSFKNIIYVLNLFYYSKPVYTVFAFRLLDPVSPSHGYIGKMPKWLKKLPLPNLIRSIKRDKKINLAFYLKRHDYKTSYDAIKKYYETKGIVLKNLEDINYKNKKHMLLSLVCHLSYGEIQTKNIYKKLDESVVLKQEQFNREMEPFTTLLHKRLYQISPLVGVFKLERFDNMDYKDILRKHWEYFAYNTPLWRKRIKDCNGTLNKEKFTLEFSDDDNESFYDKYNYEPDEQSKEVQEKSICPISKEGLEWFTGIKNVLKIEIR
jgi:hypothetical protein